MWTERRKNYCEQLFSTAAVFPPAKKKYSQTHTHTKKNQLLPKSLLYVGSVYVFLSVCMCVGSAVPPGCPETNWQLEKLWLQGKASKARDGDKEERAGEGREIEGRKKKGTRHNNIHKGRAGSAKCGQQSLYLCDADSPLFIHTFRGGKSEGEGGKVFTLTRTWHLFVAILFYYYFFSKQYRRVENNSFS